MTFETADDVLEHFGVKGMQWGVRKQQAASAGKAVGRGAKATGKFAWEHKKGVAMVAAGALLAATIVKGTRGGRHISDAEIRRLPRALRFQGAAPKPNSRQLAPFMAQGKNWIVEANDGHTFDVLVRNLAEQGR